MPYVTRGPHEAGRIRRVWVRAYPGSEVCVEVEVGSREWPSWWFTDKPLADMAREVQAGGTVPLADILARVHALSGPSRRGWLWRWNGQPVSDPQ